MPISRTNQVAPFPSGNVEQDPNANRYMPMPTPADMRRRSLFGMPLKSQFTGESVADATLQDYINASISELEHELDLYITPVTFSERQDYNAELNLWSFGYLKLNHAPILSVQKFEVAFNNGQPSTNVISIPLELVNVQPMEGTVQLIPVSGTGVSGFVSSSYGGGFVFDQTLMRQWPGAITVTYTAGFEASKIPALLGSLIENLAAYKFLSTLGPILFPTNSVGISIDGVSQSTSTPGPAFLAQRLGELEKMIQSQKEAAKGYYLKRWLVDFL